MELACDACAFVRSGCRYYLFLQFRSVLDKTGPADVKEIRLPVIAPNELPPLGEALSLPGSNALKVKAGIGGKPATIGEPEFRALATVPRSLRVSERAVALPER